MFTKNTVSEYVLRTWQISKILSVKLEKHWNWSHNSK